MKNSVRTNLFNSFRPLKEFEDQLDEIFTRKELGLRARRSHHMLKYHTPLASNFDDREIDAPEEVGQPVPPDTGKGDDSALRAFRRSA